jgi:hypothetical protein
MASFYSKYQLHTILIFQIYLNDLDISADYMDRLIEETLSRLPQVFLGREVVRVKEELGQLHELSNRFRSSSKVSGPISVERNSWKVGLDQLFNQLTKPRLRGLLEDCYRDVTYELDEDGFALSEEDDLVRKRFVRGWEGMIDGYKVSLVEALADRHAEV